MDFFEANERRRSYYMLESESPISDDEIIEMVKRAVFFTPSAYDSRSSRVLLLFNENHEKFWNIVMATLRKRVPADKFSRTEEKINGFAAAHATVLFFEDQETVEEYQERFPSYAESFVLWSLQSAGMLQYVIWAGLESKGLGANIQHYNPIIDDEVKDIFGIPQSWRLLAQMPFGTSAGEPGKKEFESVDARVRVLK